MHVLTGRALMSEFAADREPLCVVLKSDAAKERVRARSRCPPLMEMDRLGYKIQWLVKADMVRPTRHPVCSGVAMGLLKVRQTRRGSQCVDSAGCRGDSISRFHGGAGGFLI